MINWKENAWKNKENLINYICKFGNPDAVEFAQMTHEELLVLAKNTEKANALLAEDECNCDSCGERIDECECERCPSCFCTLCDCEEKYKENEKNITLLSLKIMIRREIIEIMREYRNENLHNDVVQLIQCIAGRHRVNVAKHEGLRDVFEKISREGKECQIAVFRDIMSAMTNGKQKSIP